MYNFFYPENNQKLPLPDFETIDDALDHWRNTHATWEEIVPQSAGNIAAFINPGSGVIVVLQIVRTEEQL